MSVRLAIDVIRQQRGGILANRRVGLLTNPASVTADLVRDVDVLQGLPGVEVRCLFGPEHGVWGHAAPGEDVPSATDPATGLPVYSLYGPQRRPRPEMLVGLDAVVVHLQDIGARYYTFAATLAEVMMAAAEAGVAVTTTRVGAMFGLFFTSEKVETYAQATACDIPAFNRFFHAMLDQGVFLAPSAYEAGFLSSAHDDAVIEATLAAARVAFKATKG